MRRASARSAGLPNTFPSRTTVVSAPSTGSERSGSHTAWALVRAMRCT